MSSGRACAAQARKRWRSPGGRILRRLRADQVFQIAVVLVTVILDEFGQAGRHFQRRQGALKGPWLGVHNRVVDSELIGDAVRYALDSLDYMQGIAVLM